MGSFGSGDGSGEFENTRLDVIGFSGGGTAQVQADGGTGPGAMNFLVEERDDPSVSVVDERLFAPPGSGGRQVEFIPTDRSGLPRQRPTYRGSFIRVGAAGASTAAGVSTEYANPTDNPGSVSETTRRTPEDTDPTDDPGGTSEETEVLGDDEFLREIATAVVHKIQNSAINEQGFIEDLVFKLKPYDNLGGNERSDIRYGSEENVYIFVQRYQIPSVTTVVQDYVPTSNMPGFGVTTDSRVIYSLQERDSLNQFLGNKKTNSEQVRNSIESIFGSLTGEADLNFENSIITNRLENTKKIKLSSF